MSDTYSNQESGGWDVVVQEHEPSQPQREKSAIFPHVEDYEADSEIAEMRQRILDIISRLDDACRSVYDHDYASHLIDSTTHAEKMAELNVLIKPLRDLGITKAYLDEHSEDLGHGLQFTAEARSNPRFITEWIAHDIVSIIDKLSGVMDAARFQATVGSVTMYKKALDAD